MFQKLVYTILSVVDSNMTYAAKSHYDFSFSVAKKL